MANTRDIRRLAFQALFQLDARGESDLDAVRASVLSDPAVDLTDEEREQAYQLAIGAYADRRAADDAIRELAPTWPAHRQPAVDRVILRLAHYEMTRDGASPKIAVNEAIELAKQFSTERSPAFINGVLDKVLKRVLAQRDEGGGAAEGKSEMGGVLSSEF
ncbi:MAG: transcription antitermination factor NusB [Phycisphaeraceae bacterium]|nr:MAG: transcription antitermination factor NusB [Phycisphaeraceae bacterium]